MGVDEDEDFEEDFEEVVKELWDGLCDKKNGIDKLGMVQLIKTYCFSDGT